MTAGDARADVHHKAMLEEPVSAMLPIMGLSIAAAEPSLWEFGWEALVAIGTMLLAIATFILARSTRGLAEKTAEEVQESKRQVDASLQQVEAAQQQAVAAQEALIAAHEQTRLAQLTLNAQIRPVLIDMPGIVGVRAAIVYPGREEPVLWDVGVVHVEASDDEVLVSVPLRNAGAGLAMIRGLNLTLRTEVGQPPIRDRASELATERAWAGELPGYTGRCRIPAVARHHPHAP